MEKQIFIGGFGGQGSLLIGQMIGYAAKEIGLNSAYFPEYETALRGGASNCTVITSEDSIKSLVLDTFDCVVAMDERTLKEHAHRVKPNGTLIVNTSLAKEKVYRTDITVYEIPMNDMAVEIGNDRVSNIIMLGAINQVMNMVSNEAIIEQIQKMFEGKEKVMNLNIAAFEAGRAFVAK